MHEDIYWAPRNYYIFRNKTSGKMYVGQTKQSLSHYCGSGRHWINHCKKHGGHNKKNIETVWSHWFEDEELAQLFLDEFEDLYPGYHLKENTEWANDIPENTATSVFQDPRSNPNNIPHLKQAMVKNNLANVDARERARVSMTETKRSVEWKETVGVIARKKISEKLTSSEWLEKNTIECKVCGKKDTVSKIAQWHNNNCKMNPEAPPRKNKKTKTSICPHCCKEGESGNMKRYHFENCKFLK